MKTKSKALLLTLCAVLLVAASVLGTFAYLTYQETVTNTFTVGKVTFGDPDPTDPANPKEKGLDEADVDEYGVIETDSEGNPLPRTNANTYKLLPGHNYIKDPTVHVNYESEDCYIFVKVENGLVKTIDDNEVNIEAANRMKLDDDGNETTEYAYRIIAEQITEVNGWTKLTGVKDKDGNAIDNVYWKKWTKTADPNPDDTDKTADLLVFSNFEIDGTYGTEILEKFVDAKIIVTAYGIQADGFKDEVEAWNAGIGEGGWNKTSEGNG